MKHPSLLKKPTATWCISSGGKNKRGRVEEVVRVISVTKCFMTERVQQLTISRHLLDIFDVLVLTTSATNKMLPFSSTVRPHFDKWPKTSYF